jgi:hypothetical protein
VVGGNESGKAFVVEAMLGPAAGMRLLVRNGSTLYPMNGDMNGIWGYYRGVVNGIEGIVECAMLGLDSCMVKVVVVLVFILAVINAYLRASDALNMGDKMGGFSYIAESDLIACAQTRSHRQLSLKCRFIAQW